MVNLGMGARRMGDLRSPSRRGRQSRARRAVCRRLVTRQSAASSPRGAGIKIGERRFRCALRQSIERHLADRPIGCLHQGGQLAQIVRSERRVAFPTLGRGRRERCIPCPTCGKGRREQCIPFNTLGREWREPPIPVRICGNERREPPIPFPPLRRGGKLGSCGGLRIQSGKTLGRNRV